MSLLFWAPLNGNFENQGVLSLSGTNYNSTVSTNGKIGSCYSFNGTDCRIEYPHDKSIWNNKEISIAMWYKYAAGTTQCTVVDIAADLTIGYSYDSTNGLKFFYWRAWSNSGTRTGDNGSTTNFYNADSWHHVVATCDHNINKLYVDGILVDTFDRSSKYTTNFTPLLGSGYNKITIGKSAGSSSYTSGLVNDVRIYDHCLSPLEVKEIAQGLVLHYKLDGNGFSNENLILESHKVTGGGNASGITRTYMEDGSMKIVAISNNNNYASISFSQNSNDNVGAKLSVGDKYTISCDIKVEEGTVLPTLFINAGNAYKQLQGTIVLNEWIRVYYTSRWNDPGTTYGNISLHLGFSSAIGTYYFKNFKLEKGSFPTPWCPAPTDELYTTMGLNNEIIYDSSGYNNNGITNSNTSLYNISTVFNGSDNSIKIPFNDIIKGPDYTVSVWIYKTSIGTKSYQTILGGPSGFELEARNAGGADPVFVGWNWGKNTGAYNFNEWTLFTFVRTASNSKIYVNGVLSESGTGTAGTIPTGDYFIGAWKTATGQNYEGQMSDFRIYCTALSDSDIQLLYSAGLRADNLGGLHSYEFEEDARKGITTNRILHTSNLYESGYLELLHYDKNVYTEPDGTTWVRIFHHNDPSTNGLFASTDSFEISVYKDANRWYDIEPLMANMPMYEFMVKQKTTSSATEVKYRWIQNINPLEAAWADVKPTAVTRITTSGYTDGSNGGLWRTNSNARMCIANANSGNWYGALGSWTIYQNGFPGYPNTTITTGYLDLYIRIYTPIKFIQNTGTNALNFIEI